MNSGMDAIDNIQRRFPGESAEENYYRTLARTISAFLVAFISAFVLAVVLLNCLLRTLRRGRNPSQPHQSVAAAPQRRCSEHMVAIPIQTYGADTPSSCASTMNSELQCCAICLDEFEDGECVSVLPRCEHIFHKDCIQQWVPVRSVNCPICRVRAVDLDADPARTSCRNGGVESPSTLLALNFPNARVMFSPMSRRGF